MYQIYYCPPFSPSFKGTEAAVALLARTISFSHLSFMPSNLLIITSELANPPISLLLRKSTKHCIFVITEDGNIPAPDGTHALAGDITITTEGGLITSVSADEVEDEVEVEAETEEEMSEEASNQELGELHEALIKAMASEFKEQIATLKEEFNTQIKAVKEEFGAQPAAEKTITNKKETYGRSNTANIAYNPSDSKKAAQFDRLLKARKN